VRSIEAHNGRKGRTAKDKKSIPQALRRAADKASDPSFRTTLTEDAHAVLTYTGPVPAPAAAAATAPDAVAEAGAAEREAFGSFDGFIANCTGYLRARGLPTNSYSMNGIVRTDIDLSSHLIQVRACWLACLINTDTARGILGLRSPATPRHSHHCSVMIAPSNTVSSASPVSVCSWWGGSSTCWPSTSAPRKSRTR